ncbi:MAG: ShlB/FhaC/HecB family hemolysin secretion/activation protein, partial [Alphaproteobacteria bacterium]
MPGVAMRWLKYLIVAPIAFTSLTPLQAQEVLDRVEPTRLEQNKVDQVAHDRPAPAQMAPPVATPVLPQRELTVGAIEIVGLQVLTNSDFGDIVQDHIGRSLNRNEIAALVDRLASRAQRRFPLASARIAPQDVAANILKVEIDEGRVDSVELAGFSNRRVERALQRLADGAPVTSVALERAVLLARDIDGITINETTVKRVGDRNILVVKGAYDRFRGQVAIDNDTTRPIGPFELFGFMQSNGVFSHDDSLQAYFLASLPEPEELAFLRLRYAKRIDDAGTEVSVAGSYSRSNPGSYLAPLDIEGDGAWAGVALSRPLERSVTSSLWAEANLSFRELRQESAKVISRLDRLTVARLRLSGSASFAGGVMRSSVTLAQGVNVLGATQLGDPLSSRPDAGEAFTT